MGAHRDERRRVAVPLEDALRWDRRYCGEDPQRYSNPRALLIEHADRLPRSGLALDIAMGLGANAGFLIARGWKVVGIDISRFAVRTAKQHHPDLMPIIADLTQYEFPDAIFDVILNFYYLNRDLWPKYAHWLKPGGILIFETLTRDMLQIKNDIDPSYLLSPGELLAGFHRWHILKSRESWQIASNGSRKATASLVAVCPSVKDN